DNCNIHLSEKQGGSWFPRDPASYRTETQEDKQTAHRLQTWTKCYDKFCEAHREEKEWNRCSPREPAKGTRHADMHWRMCYNDKCRIHKAIKEKEKIWPRKFGAPAHLPRTEVYGGGIKKGEVQRVED